MKLAAVKVKEKVYAGVARDGQFFPLQFISDQLPNTMLDLIEGYGKYEKILRAPFLQPNDLIEMDVEGIGTLVSIVG